MADLSEFEDFDSFLNILSVNLEKTLPGVAAQYKMLPTSLQNSISSENYVKLMHQRLRNHDESKRKSAVLVLFYPGEDGKPEFCLQQRPEYKGRFSGQISLPGGKAEPGDISLESTALRETFEEIGVGPEEITILSDLTKVPVPTFVAPFIGFCKSKRKPLFKPDEREVAEILNVKVSDLLDGTNVQMTKRMLPLPPMTDMSKLVETSVPYYNLCGKEVWGLTASILSEVKEILLLEP